MRWLVLVALCSCEDKLEQVRSTMLREVTACPAPAVCTGKMQVSQRDVAVCAPAPSGYAAGDIVAVRELGLDTVARVKATHGSDYDLEFADGITLQRKPDVLRARLCK